MHATDLDITGKDIGDLSSADALTAFPEMLGYQTTVRTPLTPESIGRGRLRPRPGGASLAACHPPGA
jgi:hypothetical protein